MKGSSQILVVGLGNAPYPLTRHSVGHLIVDSLASRLGVHMSMNRTLGGHYGHLDIMLGTQPVTLTLFKPKALMNISGHSVLLALRKSVHAPQYMVVIHDSLEHRPLSASYKFGGSANGHNGVKSVIASLSSMDFHRLRIGIGRDKATDPAAYVLQNFPAQERQFWQHGAGIDLVTKELERIVGLLPPG